MFRRFSAMVFLVVCACLGADAAAESHPRHPSRVEQVQALFPDQFQTLSADLPPAEDLTDPAASPDDDVEERDHLPPSRAPGGETRPFRLAPPPPSSLEKIYSRRAAEPLRQYGYDLFDRGGRTSGQDAPQLPGAVQDSFILRAGDELTIIMRGQKNLRQTAQITHDGRLIVDFLPPVSAAGRTIGAVTAELQALANQTMLNTDLYISLTRLKQVSVLVMGHVRKPGRLTLAASNTVIDAMIEAGGIEKTGSLRQIRLVREGKTENIDLYRLLVLGDATNDRPLQEGDRLVVPPVGPTVGVAGSVKRPGIYELLPERLDQEQAKLSLRQMLGLAGGILSPGPIRYLKFEMKSSGEETIEETSHNQTSGLFGDGTILVVAQGTARHSGIVTLKGHTRRPGPHALSETPSLGALLDSPQVMGSDIYPLAGVIKRFHDDSLSSELIMFQPLLVRQGEFDRQMMDGDTVYLFSKTQVRALDKKKGDARPLPSGKKQDTLQSRPSEPEKEPDLFPEDWGTPEDEALPADLAAFLTERQAYIRGEVRYPGAYPVAEGTTLTHIAAAAGGLTIDADRQSIEVTSPLQGQGHQILGRSGTQRLTIDILEQSPDTVLIGPGDTIRVNPKRALTTAQTVTISGEVKRPGQYDLMAGDRLSSLLARAGGLTDQAYPPGAIFSRQNERKREETRFRSAARELERSIAEAMQDDDKKISSEQIQMARDLAADLREVEAVGRITVEADPAILGGDPQQDILLEAGDRIFIPKRPLNVRVTGEVLSPASLQFRNDKKPGDYIKEAGGYTFNADKDRTFVVYPDGSAEPLEIGSWSHKTLMIPPGSTIVVPHDPDPYTFATRFKDITEILSNLAITGIFLQDLKDD